MPLDSNLDSVGPMVHTVEDAALLYQILAGPDPAAPHTWGHPCENVLEDLEADISGMRICLPREYFWDQGTRRWRRRCAPPPRSLPTSMRTWTKSR